MRYNSGLKHLSAHYLKSRGFRIHCELINYETNAPTITYISSRIRATY